MLCAVCALLHGLLLLVLLAKHLPQRPLLLCFDVAERLKTTNYVHTGGGKGEKFSESQNLKLKSGPKSQIRTLDYFERPVFGQMSTTPGFLEGLGDGRPVLSSVNDARQH